MKDNELVHSDANHEARAVELQPLPRRQVLAAAIAGAAALLGACGTEESDAVAGSGSGSGSSGSSGSPAPP